MFNFRRCKNATKISIGDKVTISNNDFSNKFNNLRNLINCSMPYENVTSMASTYSYCYNLTGSPICGNNVINMGWAYRSCYNLTGSPVCEDNVTDM